jgi:hypothetical protein
LLWVGCKRRAHTGSAHDDMRQIRVRKRLCRPWRRNAARAPLSPAGVGALVDFRAARVGRKDDALTRDCDDRDRSEDVRTSLRDAAAPGVTLWAALDSVHDAISADINARASDRNAARIVRLASEQARLARETADIRMRGRPGVTSDHNGRFRGLPAAPVSSRQRKSSRA